MVDEPEKISLELLGKLMRGLVSDVSEMKAVQAKDHAAIARLESAMGEMQTDIKELGLATGLPEIRMGKVVDRLDRIEKHLGPLRV